MTSNSVNSHLHETAKALRYARRLIEFDSSSFLSNRLISQYLEMKLTKHDFVVERLSYDDPAGVTKYCLVAKKGSGTGGMAWFGHMDTVPAPRWREGENGPFEPVVENGRLYGRGSCDMKGGIACMMGAGFEIPVDAFKRPLYIVLTADEETGFAGASHVAEESKMFRKMADESVKGVIGEPTELRVIHAHKGSVMMRAVTRGIAAHSSTTRGRSSNWEMIGFLQAIKDLRDETESESKWQNANFDPPGMSINVCLQDNSPAINVTASQTECRIYLRSMPNVDHKSIVNRLTEAARRYNVEFTVSRSADPMFTDPNSGFVQEVLQLCNQKKSSTVSYGTDGAVLGAMEHMVVCGPGSIAQAHTDDEWIAIEQINAGTILYSKMIQQWCL